jgi:hypothetical protein
VSAFPLHDTFATQRAAQAELLSRLWWNTAPVTTEPTTLEQLAAVRLVSDGHSVRITCILLLLPSLWFGTSDFALADGDAEWLTARVLLRALLVGTLVAGAWLIPASRTRREYELRVVFLTLLCVAAVIGLNALRPATAGLPLRTPLMWLFALYTGFHNRPPLQVIAPYALTLGLLALPAFWDPGAHRDSVSGNLLVLLTVNALGTLLVMRKQDLAEHEQRWALDVEARVIAERALRELQTLKGIIPICAFCKRVRTEAGDWQQVEAYVHAHSAADFSHGLCPHCTNEHYAEYLTDDPPAPNKG